MPISLHLNRQALQRLGKLTLACDPHRTSTALMNVLLHITGSIARFAASDGTMLAVLRCSAEGAPSQAIRIVLDRVGLVAAVDQLEPVVAGQTVSIDISPTEVRFSRGAAAALVRVIDAGFPLIDTALASFDGAAWMPAMNTINSKLIARAEKIVGQKRTLFWSSPVPKTSTLMSAFQTGPLTPDQVVTIPDLRHGVGRPALWADQDLLLLVMPINRPVESCDIDVGQFLVPAAREAAIAA